VSVGGEASQFRRLVWWGWNQSSETPDLRARLAVPKINLIDSVCVENVREPESRSVLFTPMSVKVEAKDGERDVRRVRRKLVVELIEKVPNLKSSLPDYRVVLGRSFGTLWRERVKVAGSNVTGMMPDLRSSSRSEIVVLCPRTLPRRKKILRKSVCWQGEVEACRLAV
jgi:hypothetical protein